ncbi:MAG: aminotransferase class I/II-fold pyridoxal phosphate-dependent enzyme, partial [Planctomycetota bacterium]
MSFRHEIESNLEKELAATKARGLYRSIKPQPADRVDFVTNDYLCLSRREELVNAAVLAARNEGAGARAARLLGGDGAAHRAAEERCAKWMKTESALLLPSGSQANFAILGALLREGDCVFSDIHNHASIVDGIRLTKARRFIYSALEDLEDQLLSASSARRRIIITDAIFSIDGRFAELNEIVALAEMYKAGVVVDEAHAAGVVGPKGRGLCAREGVDDRVLARVVTGGKALGVAGAFIVGSRFVIDSVINYSRAFIFTTAPPAPVAAALAAAIEIVENADAERARLQHLQQFFHKQLESNGIEVEERNCPIVYIELGSAMRAAAVAESLQNELLDIRAIRPPTVPVGWSG